MGKNKEIEFLEKLKSKAMYLCDNYNKLDEDTFMKKWMNSGIFLMAIWKNLGLVLKIFAKQMKIKNLSPSM